MKIYFVLISFFFSVLVHSQLQKKVNWGEVTQDEIDLKQVEFEKDADIVILYEKGTSTIAGSFQTFFYRRVKILTEKGIDYANQEISYYAYKGMEKLTDVKGQTINIVNGKPEISTIDKNAIFDIKINDYYNSKKFTFPNVRVGSILEFEYLSVNQNIHHIDAWQFQHEYPTLFSQFTIENKMALKYATISIGDKLAKQGNSIEKSPSNSWRLYNLPSYTKIDYLYNQKDMAEQIIFQLSGTNSMSYAGTINPITTWKELKQERFDSYKEYLNDAVGKDIALTIPKGESELETLENTYQYFKSNYTWNKFYGIYPKQSNKQVQKEKIGNQADLNLLLNSVLKNSGFKSDLILLSSRSNGRILISYPYLGQFDKLVNLVTLNNGASYIIDASRMENELGFPPQDLFNHYAITLKPFDDSFLSLKQEISEFNSLQNYVYKDGKMNLIRTDKKNGYFNDSRPSPQITQEIENALDVALNEIKTEKMEQSKDKYHIEKIQSKSSSIDQIDFINIENPLKTIVAPFKFVEKERERFLEFDFPFYYKTDVVIDIPTGFQLEIPVGFDQTHQTTNKQFLYNQRAHQKDNKLIFQIEFYLGKAIVTDDYANVKSFFEKVNFDISKTILLKKKK
jgi:hypothetical protein